MRFIWMEHHLDAIGYSLEINGIVIKNCHYLDFNHQEYKVNGIWLGILGYTQEVHRITSTS